MGKASVLLVGIRLQKFLWKDRLIWQKPSAGRQRSAGVHPPDVQFVWETPVQKWQLGAVIQRLSHVNHREPFFVGIFFLGVHLNKKISTKLSEQHHGHMEEQSSLYWGGGGGPALHHFPFKHWSQEQKEHHCGWEAVPYSTVQISLYRYSCVWFSCNLCACACTCTSLHF